MDELMANGVEHMGEGPHLAETPEEVAEAIRPYRVSASGPHRADAGAVRPRDHRPDRRGRGALAR